MNIKYRVTALNTQNDAQTSMNLGGVFYLKLKNEALVAARIEIGNTADFELAAGSTEEFQTGNPEYRFEDSERLIISSAVIGSDVKVIVKAGLVPEQK